MIDAVTDYSLEVGRVEMDPATLAVMHSLREFMFERVYMSGEQRREQEWAVSVIRALVDHLVAHPEDIPDSYREHAAEPVTQVADYVAGMTDRYALAAYERLIGSAPGTAGAPVA
jgi:dGTPase